jgi:hypothetical protein
MTSSRTLSNRVKAVCVSRGEKPCAARVNIYFRARVCRIHLLNEGRSSRIQALPTTHKVFKYSLVGGKRCEYGKIVQVVAVAYQCILKL